MADWYGGPAFLDLIIPPNDEGGGGRQAASTMPGCFFRLNMYCVSPIQHRKWADERATRFTVLD